jgi:hypothetical protein
MAGPSGPRARREGVEALHGIVAGSGSRKLDEGGVDAGQERAIRRGSDESSASRARCRIRVDRYES